MTFAGPGESGFLYFYLPMPTCLIFNPETFLPVTPLRDQLRRESRARRAPPAVQDSSLRLPLQVFRTGSMSQDMPRIATSMPSSSTRSVDGHLS